MIGVFDTYHLTDIHDFVVGIQKHFLCLVNANLIQILYGGIFIILCKFAAQTEFIDIVFQGELIQGVGFIVCSGKAAVHISNVGGDVVGTGSLDSTHQIKLREESHERTRTDNAVELVVHVGSQDLFPCSQDIRIFVKSVDKVSQYMYFLKIVFQRRGAHKADCVLPDIMLADELVIFAAVDECQCAFGEIIASADTVGIFAEQPSDAPGRVYDAERIKVCRLVGKRGCDGHILMAQFIRKVIAEIVVSIISIFKVIRQRETVARLGGDQAAEKFGGK